MLDNPPRDFHNGFTIDEVELMSIDTALVAAPQERLEQPVIERVGSFLAPFDYGLRAICEARDLLGKPVVPQLPAEPPRKQLRNLASAASIFAFDGDDLDHTSTSFRYPKS